MIIYHLYLKKTLYMIVTLVENENELVFESKE